jgi:hypothetical protein
LWSIFKFNKPDSCGHTWRLNDISFRHKVNGIELKSSLEFYVIRCYSCNTNKYLTKEEFDLFRNSVKVHGYEGDG